MNWIDLPDIPMDHIDYAYEGAMFLRYVDRRFTSLTDFSGRFVMRVWKEAEEAELPLQTLSRLIRATEAPAADAHQSGSESLAKFEDFCNDSYFVGDPGSLGFAYDVAARFGTPTLSGQPLFDKLSDAPVEGDVDHLACRYYRFAHLPLVDGIAFKLKLGSKCDHIHAFASVCGPYLRRTACAKFGSSEGSLVVNLNTAQLLNARSIIVTIVNCARADTFDKARFTLSASLARTHFSGC